MFRDVRIGFTIWKNIINVRLVAIRSALWAAAGLIATMAVAPRLYERVHRVALAANIDGDTMIAVLALFHIITFGIAMKQIVYRSYCRNRDLFYQLAVSKRAGRVCMMFQQLNWYGYAMVILLAICDKAVAPRGLLILTGTLLFIIGFCVCCSTADPDIYNIRKRARNQSRVKAVSTSRPTWEVLKMTVCGFYQCKGLTACKVLLIFLLVYCGTARMLHGGIFLLADAFLILLNDGYWRNESRNFRYFSEIGIPVSRYLCVHFLAGICFNICIPLLLFYCMTGEAATAAVGFCLLSYLLIFWYIAQVYLYLIIGRDIEGVIMLCNLFFLLIAILPPVGVLVMVWLYKRVVYHWRERECSR